MEKSENQNQDTEQQQLFNQDTENLMSQINTDDKQFQEEEMPDQQNMPQGPAPNIPLLRSMIIQFQQLGVLSQQYHVDYYMQIFIQKRMKMIANFCNARNPAIYIKAYTEQLLAFQQNPKYQEQFKELKMKEKAPYKINHEPKDLLKYQRMNVKDLLMEEENNYSYIEVEIFLEPMRGQGYHFIAEDTISKDEPSNTICCSVYGLDKFYDVQFYEIGQRIVILNPFLRFGNDNAPFVKVDDKSNLLFLEPDQCFEDIVKEALESLTATDLKNMGNKEFQNLSYQQAINLYTRGIKKCQSSTDSELLGILYGNRCQCYIQLKKYEQAYNDACESYNIQPVNPKFQYRKARAMVYVGKEEEALKLLNKLPVNDDVKEAIEDCKERINQKKGKYSFFRLLQQFKNTKDKYNLDALEYLGPVEVQVIPGKGRGMVATRDIKQGEFLLAEKAFSLSGKRQPAQFEVEQSLAYQTNPENVSLLRNTQIEMLNYPAKAKRLVKLFNGRNAKEEVNLQEFEKIDENDQVVFHYEDVDKIIKFNSCQCWSLEEMFKFLKSGKPRSDDEVLINGKLNALWLKFAFFNHSCEENTDRFSIGNILFVKAKRNIAKGEELTTLYIPFDMPYPEKQRRLTWYQFRCNCQLCQKTIALSNEVKGMLTAIWREVINKDKSEESIARKMSFYLDIYPKILEKLGSERFYLAEIHLLQQEMMCIYCSQANQQMFMKIWNDYKPFIRVIQDVLNVKNVTDKSFKGNTQVGLEVAKTYKQIFMQTYDNDEKLFEYLK